ncbi:MAG TPA: hypothetical protein VL625_02815 [Patescibacteria group bacterium]|nr:hypothetical protein [Patescibacteria group bacterium]
MKKLALVTVSALLVSTAAYASDDSAVCHIVSSHAQAAASAAYTPGVDVNGKPVAPADVNATPPMAMPDVVRMPITVDMAQQLAAAPAGTEMKADMGWVEIHGDGKVMFEGQDVTAKTQTLCANVPAQEETPAAEHHAAAHHTHTAHAAHHAKSNKTAKHEPKTEAHEAMAPDNDGGDMNKAMAADKEAAPAPAPAEDHEMKMAAPAPAPTPAAPPAMEAPDAPQPPALGNAAPAPAPANPFAADDSPHVPSPPPGANAPAPPMPPGGTEPASGGGNTGMTWSSDQKAPNDGGPQGQ